MFFQSKYLHLAADEIVFLKDIVSRLRDNKLKEAFRKCELDLINVRLPSWSTFTALPQPQVLFPVMDLWRVFALHPDHGQRYKGADR